jgi:hypothetical protein
VWTGVGEADDAESDRVNDLRRELFRQCEVAEHAMPPSQLMSIFVPWHGSHDDLLNAAALVVYAQPLGTLRTGTGRRRTEREL